MACSLNMFNNEQAGLCPRISFSNDFADPHQPIKKEHSYREAPVSSDFEFSAPNYGMITADELFFKGKILPSPTKINTLRDELLNDDEDDDNVSPRMGKGTSRWKEMLGLKRSHKKSDHKIRSSHDGSLESIDELKIQDIIDEDVCHNFKGFL